LLVNPVGSVGAMPRRSGAVPTTVDASVIVLVFAKWDVIKMTVAN